MIKVDGEKWRVFKEGELGAVQVTFFLVCTFLFSNGVLTLFLFGRCSFFYKIMPNYPIENLKAAHELWFKHQCRCNAHTFFVAEQAALAKKAASLKKANAEGDGPFDMADIDNFYKEKGKGPHLVEMDWKPVTKKPIRYRNEDGDLKLKWNWQHKLTGKVITRYERAGEDKGWDTSNCYAYFRKVQRLHHPRAYDRYQYIRLLNGLKSEIATTAEDKKGPSQHPREKLLLQQTKAVMAAIEQNSAAISLQGTFAKRYYQELDPLHKSPQNKPFMRIVRLLEEAVKIEYKKIVQDNVLVFGTNFACSNSDFYTNKERRDMFGCIVSNMQAKQYHLVVRVPLGMIFHFQII